MDPKACPLPNYPCPLFTVSVFKLKFNFGVYLGVVFKYVFQAVRTIANDERKGTQSKETNGPCFQVTLDSIYNWVSTFLSPNKPVCSPLRCLFTIEFTNSLRPRSGSRNGLKPNKFRVKNGSERFSGNRGLDLE